MLVGAAVSGEQAQTRRRDPGTPLGGERVLSAGTAGHPMLRSRSRERGASASAATGLDIDLTVRNLSLDESMQPNVARVGGDEAVPRLRPRLFCPVPSCSAAHSHTALAEGG